VHGAAIEHEVDQIRFKIESTEKIPAFLTSQDTLSQIIPALIYELYLCSTFLAKLFLLDAESGSTDQGKFSICKIQLLQCQIQIPGTMSLQCQQPRMLRWLH